MKNLSRSHINKRKRISDILNGGWGSEIGPLIKATYLGYVEYFFFGIQSIFKASVSIDIDTTNFSLAHRYL